MATIGTTLYTLFFGKHMGDDQYGNRYYESKKRDFFNRPRRWVIYKGLAEPSKVPPEWHGWLHHMTGRIPLDKKHAWQKDHIPNLTGTRFAYFPKGYYDYCQKKEKVQGGSEKGGQEEGYYQAWKPHT